MTNDRKTDNKYTAHSQGKRHHQVALHYGAHRFWGQRDLWWIIAASIIGRRPDIPDGQPIICAAITSPTRRTALSIVDLCRSHLRRGHV